MNTTSFSNTAGPCTNNELAMPTPPATYNELSINVEVLALVPATIKLLAAYIPPVTTNAPMLLVVAAVALVINATP